MGRRRRRVIRIVKKKLPTVFVCPRCGEEAVRVTIAKDTGHATVLCALCNLKDEFPAHPAAQAIDVYSYFTDRFYGVKDPRAIMPRDREIQAPPPEEETTEEAVVVGAGEKGPELPTEKVEAGKSEPESRPLFTEQPPETSVPAEPSLEKKSIESSQAIGADSSHETEVPAPEETQTESQEEREPFADILENKDKKRYSSTPLPSQTSEQTN